MKAINHECYVDLEVAKLLKKAGFDWEGTSYYQHGIFYPYSIDRERLVVMNQSSAPDYMEQYSAPTLDVAQRWLREREGFDINAGFTTFPEKEYYATIYKRNIQYSISNNSFNTYEEALETGIKRALEIIL